jgi:hypothetical protein
MALVALAARRNDCEVRDERRKRAATSNLTLKSTIRKDRVTYKKLFLKQNILAEPLFNQWYAWPYLIPPASAAIYIANSHLKTMQSFVSAPQIHVSALKNPAMIGGPFINYDPSKVPDIKRLIDKTLTEQKIMVEFAEAIKTLDQMLVNEATGYSMEAHYSKVPIFSRDM